MRSFRSPRRIKTVRALPTTQSAGTKDRLGEGVRSYEKVCKELSILGSMLTNSSPDAIEYFQNRIELFSSSVSSRIERLFSMKTAFKSIREPKPPDFSYTQAVFPRRFIRPSPLCPPPRQIHNIHLGLEMQTHEALSKEALTNERLLMVYKMQLRAQHDLQELNFLKENLVALSNGKPLIQPSQEEANLKSQIGILKEQIRKERIRIKGLESGKEFYFAAYLIQKVVRGFLVRMKLRS